MLSIFESYILSLNAFLIGAEAGAVTAAVEVQEEMVFLQERPDLLQFLGAMGPQAF